MTQSDLLDVLNCSFNLDLKGTDKDQYCRWDAESDKYLAELKCRRTHYDTQLIEYDKLIAVQDEADKQGKEFIYCVASPKGVYVFNVSKLHRENYDFGWEDRGMPSNTDFTNKYHKQKRVGYIDVNCATFS